MKLYRRGEGRWLVLMLLVGLGIFAWREVYPFLARQAPVPADMLVVEGWLNDELLAQAASWAESNGVKKIVATGGPLETGGYLIAWKTYAEMTRARMEALGLGAKFELAAVPAEKVRRGRTRESARALKAAGIGDKLPDLAKLREEYSKLSEEKDRLYAEYGSLKKRMREYDAVKQNIDSILSPNRGQEQDKAL